jgi:hypothetical protein
MEARMDRILQFLEKDQFARGIGIELIDVGSGRAKAKMEILNFQGMVYRKKEKTSVVTVASGESSTPQGL